MPHLAALVCHSLFDLAIHDAFGQLVNRPVFETFTPEFLNSDLANFLEHDARFRGRWPAEFLQPRADRLPVWHLVGGLDPMDPEELTGNEPNDGYPVSAARLDPRDGLKCLKVKLRGKTMQWD